MNKPMNKVPTAEELEGIKYDLGCAGRNADEDYTAEEIAAWRIIGETDWCEVVSLGCNEYLLTGDRPEITDGETMRHHGRELALACGLGEQVVTDGGDYQIIADIDAGGSGDERISVYVGRHLKLGHCDLIAKDNASYWVVGDEDNHGRNRDQWATIEDCCGRIDLEAVRRVDEDLADWLADRRKEAEGAIAVYPNEDAYRNCNQSCDDYEYIAADADTNIKDVVREHWDEMPCGAIIERGIGDDKVLWHLGSISDVSNGEGMPKIGVEYYLAPWDEECGDCDACRDAADADEWHYLSADGVAMEDEDILAKLPAKRKATEDEIARLTDQYNGNYSAADAEGAEVIAEDNNGCILYRLPDATSDIKYAVEGATGDIMENLDYREAIEEWS